MTKPKSHKKNFLQWLGTLHIAFKVLILGIMGILISIITWKILIIITIVGVLWWPSRFLWGRYKAKRRRGEKTENG